MPASEIDSTNQDEKESSMAEYGVFEDGDLRESGFIGSAGRVAAGATATVLANENPGMAYGTWTVKELCPEHDEQPLHGCAECGTEEQPGEVFTPALS
jgi:hypothetical protein